MKTIVLARIEMTGVRETGRLVRFDGYNYRPETESTPEPNAMIWLNEGTESDEAKASAFAQREGYTVFTFSTCEREPLESAKKLMTLKSSSNIIEVL